MENKTIMSSAIGSIDAKEELNKFLKKRSFNLPIKEDKDSITGGDLEREVFIPTSSEYVRIAEIIAEGKKVEEETLEVLRTLCYSDVYCAAVKKLDDFWKDVLKVPYSEKSKEVRAKEKEDLEELTKEVYKYRHIADLNNEDLEDHRKAWMGLFPVKPETFIKYATMLKLEPGSAEAEHARLNTPACLISKFNLEDAKEAKSVKQEFIEEEINRDKWFDYDVYGKDGRTRDRDKVNGKAMTANDIAKMEEQKILRQFSWLIDPETSDLYDIGSELYVLGYDTLFVSDIIKQRLNYVGLMKDVYYEILMGGADRVNEASQKECEREAWRAEVAKGKIPSFKYDFSMLQFGRQKDIVWNAMGGTFKSAWGAKLRFEAIAKLSEEDLIKCKNITCYDDGTKNGKEYTVPSTENSYQGMKRSLFSGYKIRKASTPTYKQELEKWNDKLVQLCIDQNATFGYQLSKLENLELPDDEYGYNALWYKALIKNRALAKEKVATRAEKIIVDHDYSALYDVFGEEADELAFDCLMAVKEVALKATEEQKAYIGDRKVAGYAEDSECCAF